MKSVFVRTIGKASLNNFEFDVYKNEDGSAEIRVLKNGRNQKKLTVEFESLEALEKYLEVLFFGEESIFETVETAAEIQKLKEVLVDSE